MPRVRKVPPSEDHPVSVSAIRLAEAARDEGNASSRVLERLRSASHQSMLDLDWTSRPFHQDVDIAAINEYLGHGQKSKEQPVKPWLLRSYRGGPAKAAAKRRRLRIANSP
jgi:hypothetical protein